jgi:hypothetical protein
MKSLRSTIARLKQALDVILTVNQRFDLLTSHHHELRSELRTRTDVLRMKTDELQINQGIMLAELVGKKESKSLNDYEFKVFSQWGEDGIIQRLIGIIEIKHKTFIEFGVEDFMESNCRFLLMKDNWSGFVIDESASNISRLKESYFYWKHDISAIDAFINKENINDLMAQSGFADDLGILSIDLDGNDYYILEAITSFRPRILICEYNAVFGGTRSVSIPYEPDFVRTNRHYSKLYWGASLAAITYIANQKGYSLVGTNTARNNAFFVRNDLVNDKMEVLSAKQAYAPSLFKESIDEQGQATFVTGEERLQLIRGLPVFNVEMKIVEEL